MSNDRKPKSVGFLFFIVHNNHLKSIPNTSNICGYQQPKPTQ